MDAAGAVTLSPRLARVIFKRVSEGRPYPDHGLDARGWAQVPPRQVRLDELVTTKDTLVLWRDELYLEDGLHRALRAALQQRHVLHARVHEVAG